MGSRRWVRPPPGRPGNRPAWNSNARCILPSRITLPRSILPYLPKSSIPSSSSSGAELLLGDLHCTICACEGCRPRRHGAEAPFGAGDDVLVLAVLAHLGAILDLVFHVRHLSAFPMRQRRFRSATLHLPAAGLVCTDHHP